MLLDPSVRIAPSLRHAVVPLGLFPATIDVSKYASTTPLLMIANGKYHVFAARATPFPTPPFPLPTAHALVRLFVSITFVCIPMSLFLEAAYATPASALNCNTVFGVVVSFASRHPVSQFGVTVCGALAAGLATTL